MVLGGDIVRRRSAGPIPAGRQRLRVAGTTLVSGGSIITSATDRRNGVRFVLQNPAAGAQLPHTGNANYTTPLIKDRYGTTVTRYWSAHDLITMQVLERVRPSVSPGLLRVGMFVSNTPDPVTVTEGYGCYLEYPSTTIRQVGGWRVSAANTWVSSSGTGNVNTFGARGEPGVGGQAVVRNLGVIATWASGEAMAPQASNFVVIPAADATQGSTQNKTLGVPITWYVGISIGWDAAGGTGGVNGVWDFQYWIQDRPDRG